MRWNSCCFLEVGGGGVNTKMHVFLLQHIFLAWLGKKHLQCTAIHAVFGRQRLFSLAKIWLRCNLIPTCKYFKGSYGVNGTKFFSVVAGDLIGDNGHYGGSEGALGSNSSPRALEQAAQRGGISILEGFQDSAGQSSVWPYLVMVIVPLQ